MSNIAERLRESARLYPWRRAVVFPNGRDRGGRVAYSQLTFEQLDRESDRLARGLREWGVTPGTRLVLMVPPSLEFIALTFALFKAGAVAVLIDPGMGRSNIFRCLEVVEPEGFVAVPLVQAIRKVYGRRFPKARFNVTVPRPGVAGFARIWPSAERAERGRRGEGVRGEVVPSPPHPLTPSPSTTFGRWLCGGVTYRQLLGREWSGAEMAETASSDPAAVIFTSGSTGPPKGVVYEHGMFDAQVELLREFYGIEPGEIDLPGFPLFALFNTAMGVTTVIPDMDPTRPAHVDAEKILEAMRDQGVTQAFGSPALWNRVGRYCEERGLQLPASVKRILSAGAPVPMHVIARMRRAFANDAADIHTPYGATESLPICSIAGREVLERSAPRSRQGAGTCVGRRFPHISVKIVEITDGPIRSLAEVRELPAGEIGEIIVQGPVATREYFKKPEATAAAKVPDGDSFWHRMGDVGYLDDEGLLWFCGRKAHIVETLHGRMFTIPCEAIFNEHPRVYRSALVGIGQRPNQTPVIVVEPEAGQFPRSAAARANLIDELLQLAKANPLTERIEHVLFHPSLPVDIRHNVKIFREKLTPWATKQLR